MIIKKSRQEIQIMRRAGAILGDTMARLRDAVRPGVTTGGLDRIAHEAIAAAGARPSFLGYRGFPASICTSPNHVIVHGIPGPLALSEGDIVSIDVGVHYQGFHADSAWTFPVGTIGQDAAHLLKIGEACLDAAIGQCRPGNRIGDIGFAVEETAASAGYSVVREYVGHGIGRALHEDPQVPNYGPPGRREMLAEGMTIAIEPMVNAGGPGTETLDDGWTVVTADGNLSSHFEHTVAVTAEGCEVLTLPDGRPPA